MVDPTGMSALIAGTESDRDQLDENLRRLGEDVSGAVTVVGGPVAQALGRFLADADDIGGQARERALRTIEAARQVLRGYEDADEEMAGHHRAAAAQHAFEASRFSAKVPR